MHGKRWAGVIGIAIVLTGAAAAGAADGPADVLAMLQRLEQRLGAQERQIAVQNAKIAELEAQQNTGRQREAILAVMKEMELDAGQQGGLPDWLENFKLFGDFRLRYQFQCYNTGEHEEHQGRFRLRVGGEKTWLQKQLTVIFRLASGSSEDPTSTNQSFHANFSEKSVWIDLAYAIYKPEWLPGFTIMGGKMKKPFFHTDLIWDADVNPEGVWAQYKVPGLGDFEPFVGVGVFPMYHNADAGDAELHAYQVGNRWKITDTIQWTVALAYYDFGHYEDNYTTARTNTVSGGRLTAEDFNVLNLTNKVNWVLFNLPMAFYIDYAHNCGNKDGGQSDAYALGLQVGQAKKKGDWLARYKWAHIEANATAAALNDASFGGTNRKGHVFAAAYKITDSLTTGVTLYVTDGIGRGYNQNTYVLVLADLLWEF